MDAVRSSRGGPAPAQESKINASRVTYPWRSLLALGIALVAQLSLLPRPNRTWILGVILYILAAGWLAYSSWKGEWLPADLPEAEDHPEDYRLRSRWLYISLPLALAAFLTLGGNRFTQLERHSVGAGDPLHPAGFLAG